MNNNSEKLEQLLSEISWAQSYYTACLDIVTHYHNNKDSDVFGPVEAHFLLSVAERAAKSVLYKLPANDFSDLKRANELIDRVKNKLDK